MPTIYGEIVNIDHNESSFIAQDGKAYISGLHYIVFEQGGGNPFRVKAPPNMQGAQKLEDCVRQIGSWVKVRYLFSFMGNACFARVSMIKTHKKYPPYSG